MDSTIFNFPYDKELTNDDYEVSFYCEMKFEEMEDVHSERFTLFLTEIY